MELPTGRGKTLVGLLVGEYRRRTFGDRVAFLCPNVQLANQAAEKAHSYGMDTVLLVRRQADWEPSEFQQYQRAKAIAIGTYFQVFNTNPRMDSPQTLILDDAHVGEEVVADMWSLHVKRADNETLYRLLLEAVAEDLPPPVAAAMRDTALDPMQRTAVELVPPMAMYRRRDALAAALAETAKDSRADQHYKAIMVRPSVDRCLMYLTWEELLIRPAIAPTIHHEPFADAHQRIFMSATLGEDGELERAFGVTQVARVRPVRPVEEGGSGRRFFLLPGATLEGGAVDEVITNVIDTAGRALILTPSFPEAQRVKERCVPMFMPELGAPDVEKNFDAFVNQPRAALILANRYDGMDLPDEACRLLVISGLPVGTHLQERFLFDRLGAKRVLSARIRTRLIQGAGRCTRNARDYASVVLRGSRLLEFVSREEELAAFPPELQAELRFGLDNSEQADTDFLELFDHFWAQDDEWRGAERQLASNAAVLSRSEPAGGSALQSAATAEVECWRCLWKGDFEGAVKHAQVVVDRLVGGVELRAYRALWLYLAASWAHVWREQTGDENAAKLAVWLANETVSAAAPLRWHPTLHQQVEPDPGETAPIDIRAERAGELLRSWGIRGARFESKLSTVRENLASDDHVSFALGLQGLGELLGFQALGDQGAAAPDGVWRQDDSLWLTFEAKTEQEQGKPIDVTTLRQAGTHLQWAKNNLSWSPATQGLSTIIAPNIELHELAVTVVGKERAITPDSVRALLDVVADAYREVRSKARAMTDEEIAATFSRQFEMRRLATEALLNKQFMRLRRGE
jgi:hypothetical protein